MYVYFILSIFFFNLSFFFFYCICMFIFVLYPFIVFVLNHDLMNYLLYICMPICCMTLVNKDNKSVTFTLYSKYKFTIFYFMIVSTEPYFIINLFPFYQLVSYLLSLMQKKELKYYFSSKSGKQELSPITTTVTTNTKILLFRLWVSLWVTVGKCHIFCHIWREQLTFYIYFWWNYNDVCFLLDQLAELELFSDSWQRQLFYR